MRKYWWTIGMTGSHLSMWYTKSIFALPSIQSQCVTCTCRPILIVVVINSLSIEMYDSMMAVSGKKLIARGADCTLFTILFPKYNSNYLHFICEFYTLQTHDPLVESNILTIRPQRFHTLQMDLCRTKKSWMRCTIESVPFLSLDSDINPYLMTQLSIHVFTTKA
jgi:hypothetical protein